MRAVPGGDTQRHCAVRSAVRRSQALAALWRRKSGSRRPRTRTFYAPRDQGHQRVTERLGEEGGGKRDAVEGQGGGGPGEEREGTRRAPRGERAGLGTCGVAWVASAGPERVASAAAPLDPNTLACPARRVPSLLECGAPLLAWVTPSSFLAVPLLGPAPRAELGAPQRPLPAPPGPGAAALPARPARSERRARRRPLFGATPPVSASPGRRPGQAAQLSDSRATRYRNLGRTRTGPERGAASGAQRLCQVLPSLPVVRTAPWPSPRRPRVEMTFRDLLSVSFEGPRPDSSAGGSSAGGGGGSAGGAAPSEGPAVGGVPGAAGGGGGGVVGAGSCEDNRSSAAEPGSAGAGGDVNGTAAVGGLVVSAQGVGVGVFLAAFILMAVAGNLLVILSVACNRHLQTVTNYFIVNLAVADLLLSATVLPFSATMEVLGFWAFGRAFCDVWAAVDVLCCTASILSLCTISVDRYVGVRHSLKYPAIMTERKAAAILALLWVVALVVSVGPLLGWKEPVPPDERFCGITEEAGYAVFSSVCSFYLPMAVIVVMYCRVYVVARSTTRSLEAGVKRERGKASEVVLRIHCRGAATGADGAHGMRSAKGHTFRSSLSVRLLKFSREKKAAKTLAIVVGVFVLCWFPFFFVLPLGE
ncbi:hypothetical protein P7K49_009395 [Saguinus oedipus]|uniref:Alpha-1D adrenergic receptor n=1 Tax=Saguinus oedipus TaxID=9490 RepID=A0ABQ9VJU7_SAGOE|nr:hypothetical protein P7K49_009395 [Saguinus oedipus]